MAIRRAGTIQEISNVVVFLASEESSYITGEAIEVSGGAGLFIF
jgi:3-oxoacyl-[acyl-carrier protein] reductase